MNQLVNELTKAICYTLCHWQNQCILHSSFSKTNYSASLKHKPTYRSGSVHLLVEMNWRNKSPLAEYFY